AWLSAAPAGPAVKTENAIIVVPSQQLSSAGRLEVVATPIGNLGDLAPRARAALMAADLIAAEDTRRTGALLAAIGVSGTLISLHEHNETSRIESLVRELEAGKVIALVSDAGTPLLSDPGYSLVRAAAAAGIEIRAIPGASTLADLTQLFGAQRRAVVARELTKLHEAVYRGTLEELSAAAIAEPNFARGEITLLIEGLAAPGEDGADRAVLARALKLLLAEMPPARAAALAAQIAGVKRSEAYALAQRLRALTVAEGEPGSQY